MTMSKKQCNPSKACTPAPSAKSSGSGQASDRARLPNTRQGNAFPKQLRITSKRDFAIVFAKGQVASNEVLVIHAVGINERRTRLGLSLSKKVGSAPVRNHWKRIIREAFRRKYDALPSNLLLVVRPRKGASAVYESVEQSLTVLAHRVARRVRVID